jgi:hypothetical protein
MVQQFRKEGVGLYAVAMLVWLLTGCQLFTPTLSPTLISTPTLETSLMDQSVLTNKPCSAPCWYGLELGKSTKAEALAILPTLSFLDPNTIEEDVYDGYAYWGPDTNAKLQATLISAECRTHQGQCVRLIIVDNTLMGIWLFPNYNLALGDVVDHLGPPEFVRAFLSQNGTTCTLVLTWEKRQIMMEYDDLQGESLCTSVNDGNGIESDLRITRLYYKLPGAFPYESRSGRPWPGFAKP